MMQTKVLAVQHLLVYNYADISIFFYSKHVYVLAWPDQSPELNQQNLYNFRMYIYRHSLSNVTELKQFCKGGRAEISVSRCAKLVEAPEIAAIIAVKVRSTVIIAEG